MTYWEENWLNRNLCLNENSVEAASYHAGRLPPGPPPVRAASRPGRLPSGPPPVRAASRPGRLPSRPPPVQAASCPCRHPSRTPNIEGAFWYSNLQYAAIDRKKIRVFIFFSALGFYFKITVPFVLFFYKNIFIDQIRVPAKAVNVSFDL